MLTPKDLSVCVFAQNAKFPAHRSPIASYRLLITFVVQSLHQIPYLFPFFSHDLRPFLKHFSSSPIT